MVTCCDEVPSFWILKRKKDHFERELDCNKYVCYTKTLLYLFSFFYINEIAETNMIAIHLRDSPLLM